MTTVYMDMLVYDVIFFYYVLTVQCNKHFKEFSTRYSFYLEKDFFLKTIII